MTLRSILTNVRFCIFSYIHIFDSIDLSNLHPLSSKENKKSYIQIIDSKGFRTHSRNERKIVKGYESIKRYAADSGSVAVRGDEVGINETLFGT